MRNLALLSLIVISACTSVRTDAGSLASQPIATRTPSAAIVLYQASKPACAYDEIATVRVKSNTMSQTDSQLAQQLRAEARALGGDAVVGVTSGRFAEGERRNDDGTISTDHSHELVGTVVRFKVQDAHCSTAGAE